MTTAAPHLGSHQRRLWRDDDSIDDHDNIVNECNDHVESIEELQRHYSSRPPLRSFSSLCQSTLVVGQEFVLVAYFLARHQQTRRDNDNDAGENRYEDETKQLVSHLFVLLALFLILLFNNNTDGVERTSNIHIRESTTTTSTYKEAFNVPQQQQHPRRIKIKQRSMDALLLALLLRLLASVLRTLTESYSSDTVHALANAGWMLHLLTCDYAYANGMEHDQDVSSTYTTTHGSATLQKRPAFLGGTVSLNAAFFSTTLLASRLSSNSKVYFFVSLSVVLFAFYPAARHGVSQHKYGHLGTSRNDQT